MANTKKGQVIEAKLDKTITVLVITYRNHPLYKKRYIYSKKYLVHDPLNKAKLKDQVIIKQSRPISRRKRWILEEIVKDNLTKTNLKKEVKVKEEDV